MDDPYEAEVVDDTPWASFAAELRCLRVQAGLSVRALARGLHRAHSSIVEYEHAQRLPGVEVVEVVRGRGWAIQKTELRLCCASCAARRRSRWRKPTGSQQSRESSSGMWCKTAVVISSVKAAHAAVGSVISLLLMSGEVV